MNYLLVLKIIGYLTTGLSLVMLAPAGVSLYYKETSWVGFLLSTIITLIVGLTLAKLPAPSQKIHIKSSIAIVVFGWLSFCFFGALPYYFCNVFSITDSVFETMSGFTTTGATVLLDIEVLDRGILFWRSMTQWLGGMGIIVLSLAIMPLLGSTGSMLYRAEVPGPSSDKLMPRLQATAKILWVVYVVFTLCSAIMLHIFGMEWYDAFCHAFTSLSTGGFSTKNASIGAYPSAAIQWTIIAFMFIGGANFSLHYMLFTTGKVRRYLKNREFVFYFLIFALAASIVFLQLLPDRHWHASLRSAAFHVISFITTTGYITEDYELWSPFAQYVLVLLMFAGGCGGSTAGGIKVVRLYVLAKIALMQVAQVLHPHGVYFIKIGKTTVREDVLGRVMGFIILYLVLIAAASLCLAFLGHDMATAFTAVASCVGNIGPGFGTVGAVENYYTIHEAGKWILVFCMLAGRLELFTVLVIFSRGFWKNM